MSQHLCQCVSAWIWFRWKVPENKLFSDFVSFVVEVFHLCCTFRSHEALKKVKNSGLDCNRT